MNAPASPEPADTPSPQPASLKARLTAKLIDATIAAAIAFAAFLFFGFATLDLFEPRVYTAAEAYIFASPFLGVLLFEAALIASTARKGTTAGKKLLNIRVVAQVNSNPPSPLRTIIRWAVPLVVAAPLVDAFIREIPELAGTEPEPALSGRAWWLWVAVGWWLLVHASTLWDSQRRGWHDKAAGTIVINVPATAPQGHYLLAKWQRKLQRRLDRWHSDD